MTAASGAIPALSFVWRARYEHAFRGCLICSIRPNAWSARRLLHGQRPGVPCAAWTHSLSLTVRRPHVRFTEAAARSRFFYEGQLRESFLRFKFGGAAFYAQTYGAWMAAHNPGQACGANTTCSHGRRSAGRESANAAMTSRRFCAARLEYSLRLESMQTLRKIKDSPAQSTLTDAAQRRANVSRSVPGRTAGVLCRKTCSDHRRYCNDWRNAGRMQPHAAAGGRVGRRLRGICRAEKTRLKDTTL